MGSFVFGADTKDEQYLDMSHLPQLSEVVNDDDQLPLNPSQLETAIEQSRRYWYHMARLAISHHRHGILPSCTNPRYLLGRVPAICGSLGQMLTSYVDSYQGRVLCVGGYSTWKATNPSCELRGEKKVQGFLRLGSQKAVPCRFDGVDLSRWPGDSGDGRNGPNYVGILALGWSYILSARLGEILGINVTMSYTSSTAMVYSENNKDVLNTVVDIGEVTEDVYRWWAAILAPLEGWKAIIVRQDNQEYLAPWSISIESLPSFGIRRRVNCTLPARPARAPPSSSEAFGYLCQFALRHNLGSQFFVALTTAMTFPTHSNHRTVIQLPLPVISEVYPLNTSATSIPSDWMTLEDELPFYMALSCNTEILISSLCGMFWEPGITCNMVSPWLHPILHEVPLAEGISGTPGLYHELLPIICSFRQPRISSLWLGAVASGLTPVILRRIRRGRPPLDANAFPWTGCPQSFMDVAGTGPYLIEGTVRRADVWRLLHLPPVVDDDLHYDSRPSTPWAPPGSMFESSCAIRVRLHLHCDRHMFQYYKWTWEAEGRSAIEDQGYSNDIHQFIQNNQDITMPALEFPRKSFDQEASEEASREIFRWVTVNGEGVPDEKIYKNDWLQDDGDIDDDDDDEELHVSGDNSSPNPVDDKERDSEINDWILGLPESMLPSKPYSAFHHINPLELKV